MRASTVYGNGPPEEDRGDANPRLGPGTSPRPGEAETGGAKEGKKKEAQHERVDSGQYFGQLQQETMNLFEYFDHDF